MTQPALSLDGASAFELFVSMLVSIYTPEYVTRNILAGFCPHIKNMLETIACINSQFAPQFTSPSANTRIRTIPEIRISVQPHPVGHSIERVDLYIMRDSDGRYWNGASWSSKLRYLATRLEGTTYAYRQAPPTCPPGGLYPPGRGCRQRVEKDW